MSEPIVIPRDLQGQTALVTGAARGLGLGIATELARHGAHVVIADVQGELAEAAVADLLKDGLYAQAAALDIGDSVAVDRTFAKIMGDRGRLDIVVNNAAIGQTVGSVSQLSDQEWARVMGVTLTGTFYCCRAAARIMETQESGRIVNISSVNGQNPAALVAAYNAAKAGVISLTRTLALEMAPYGVCVNVVCPGPIYTEFNKKVMDQRAPTLNLTHEEMVERVRAAIPLGRWGEPADIAGMVAFLCGPGAAWITGEVIRISGGLEGVSASPPKRPKQ